MGLSPPLSGFPSAPKGQRGVMAHTRGHEDKKKSLPFLLKTANGCLGPLATLLGDLVIEARLAGVVGY